LAVKDRQDRRGSGKIRIVGFDISDHHNMPVHIVASGNEIHFKIQLDVFTESAFNVQVQIECYDAYGQLCFVANNGISNSTLPNVVSGQIITCHIPKLPLNTGIYFLNAAVHIGNELTDEVLHITTLEVEQGMFYSTGRMPPPNKGFLVPYSWS
jgi:lipopolysaccharide transport system ATP-binding protein